MIEKTEMKIFYFLFLKTDLESHRYPIYFLNFRFGGIGRSFKNRSFENSLRLSHWGY
jgi:hypothetical protein